MIFNWADYGHGNRKRVVTLGAVAFIRRFLLHVLPPGFMHIRCYGFLANRLRDTKLTLARRIIARTPATHTSTCRVPSPAAGEPGQEDHQGLCPACRKGRLVIVETFQPETQTAFPTVGFDTS